MMTDNWIWLTQTAWMFLLVCVGLGLFYAALDRYPRFSNVVRHVAMNLVVGAVVVFIAWVLVIVPLLRWSGR